MPFEASVADGAPGSESLVVVGSVPDGETEPGGLEAPGCVLAGVPPDESGAPDVPSVDPLVTPLGVPPLPAGSPLVPVLGMTGGGGVWLPG